MIAENVNSVTGTWGTTLLSNKIESTAGNFVRLKEAEITANRCGFVKELTSIASEKPKSTYKSQFSENQLNDTRRNEAKNVYSRYDKLAEKKASRLQYTGEYTVKLAGTSNVDGRTIDNLNDTVEDKVNPEMLESFTKAASSSRSAKNRIHSMEAPVATGGGSTQPKGKSTSGLCGEVYNESEDPDRNSFIQRSWMGRLDPALSIRKDGRPTAKIPNETSLAIGDYDNTRGPLIEPGMRYFRQAVLTGDPLSKFGSAKAGVFVDEFPVKHIKRGF